MSEFYPRRTPNPSPESIAFYAADWAGQPDSELIQAMAHNLTSSLSGLMADDDSTACAWALFSEIDRRELRGAVDDEIARWRAMRPDSDAADVFEPELW